LDDRGGSLVAKVADFGTVRERTPQEGADDDTKTAATHSLTGAIVGTKGYMVRDSHSL
jgi:hypothetical protein